MQWYLLKDTDGKKSVSYTMLVVTFCVCTLWLCFSMFESVFHLNVREFDASGASMWFAPIATLYFSRRWAQPKNNAKIKFDTSDSTSRTEENKTT